MEKVLIIGDSCEDIFRYGKCVRLCPEAPVPIFNPTTHIKNGGMAMNLYNNLKALGIQCDIITNLIKPLKIRYVDEVSNQILLRVDETDAIEPILKKQLEMINFSKYTAVIISDYNKGYLSEEDIEFITNNQSLVFIDTKKKLDSWAAGIEFIKINEKEAIENNEWLTKCYNGELIVTLGRNGARHWSQNIPIIEEHPVRDLSGAGDTFLAALVADYINNNDICTAIQFANKCASWVVTQKGVAIVDKDKVK